MASHLLAARRRMIRARGRGMTLQRLVKGSSGIERQVSLLGYPHGFEADQMAGDVRQGDQLVETLHDELQAVAWPDRPKAPDKLLFDDRTWTLVDATPLYDGALCIGWRLWIRGGA
jgi:hypothetical protein